jgi:hypothetical protein
VQQILTNLLSNAIKFTPEGGRITVGAKGDPRGRIEFWVADTGVGIPESEKEVIFEKFRQGTAVLGRDNLTREYSGTGLGLSIVKELCNWPARSESKANSVGLDVPRPFLICTDQPTATTKMNARLERSPGHGVWSQSMARAARTRAGGCRWKQFDGRWGDSRWASPRLLNSR